VGGNKLDTKVDVLRSLINKVDVLLLGGLITEAFLIALKKSDSLADPDSKGSHKNTVDPEYVKIAKSIIMQAKRRKVKLVLSEDFIFNNGIIVSIGPATIAAFEKELARAKTIIWNGVVGMGNAYGRPATLAMAKAMKAATSRGATTIIGGGSVLEFIEKEKFKDRHFTHVSTGGGALLELLSRDSL